MDSSLLDYAMTSNQQDPNCDTGFEGYVDLAESQILPRPQIHGDESSMMLPKTAAFPLPAPIMARQS